LILKFPITTKDQRAIRKSLEENKDKTQLADILMRKEVIFKDDLETIFGKGHLIKLGRK
jgi:cell division protease FtsH